MAGSNDNFLGLSVRQYLHHVLTQWTDACMREGCDVGVCDYKHVRDIHILSNRHYH